MAEQQDKDSVVDRGFPGLKDFPRTIQNFINLHREISLEELRSASQESLAIIVVALKKKELENYILYHKAQNKWENFVTKMYEMNNDEDYDVYDIANEALAIAGQL